MSHLRPSPRVERSQPLGIVRIRRLGESVFYVGRAVGTGVASRGLTRQSSLGSSTRLGDSRARPQSVRACVEPQLFRAIARTGYRMDDAVNKSFLAIGMDVGSTTVKATVVDPVTR